MSDAPLALAARMLRTPDALSSLADDPERLRRLTPRVLGVGAIGAGLFGAIVGSYHGDWQVPLAAVKAPLLFGLPLIVTLPAVRSLALLGDVEIPWARLSLTGAVAAARTALLTATLGPLLWLFYSMSPSYTDAVLAMTLCLVAAGIPGLAHLATALPPPTRQRALIGAASVALLGVVTAQTGYLIRPFVLRPDAPIALYRPIEGDVASSLGQSARRSVTGGGDQAPVRERE